MKVCAECSAKVDDAWRCLACNREPAQIEGFIAFDPELARSSSGFKPEYFRQLADVEAGNFWFAARNKLIVWAAARYFRGAGTFCEIGCGTGYVLAGIASALPNWRLSATEIYADGLPFAAERVRGASFYQLDARHLPFVEEFDVMGAFDVLEHIDEDKRVLRAMHRAIVPLGGLLITVPQHPFLWSQQDEEACHVRRYTAREVIDKLERAGFEVVFASSFVSLLFPAMYMTRRRARVPASDYDVTADLRLPFLLNKAMSAVMTVERWLIRCGIRFPFGGSLLVVARKRENT